MTSGLDEILSNLTKLQVKAPKTAREAVTEVAEKFEKQLKANTPREGRSIEHLQEDTAISGFKGASEGIVSKEIGYGNATGGVRSILIQERFINEVKNLKKKQSIK